MDLCFIFLSFLPYFAVKGVFGVDPDEVKSVSVTEGDSVTLHTDVIKQKDDLIVWSYGPESTVVARINGKASSTFVSKDETFKGRLELDDKTGDLTITDIRSQHSGLYTLRISSNNKVSNKRFNVTVSGHVPFLALNPVTKNPQDLDSSESPEQKVFVIIAVVVSVLSVIIIIIFFIIFIVYMKKRMACLRKSSESENHLTDEKLSINSSSTSEDQETSRCLKEKLHRIGAESV